LPCVMKEFIHRSPAASFAHLRRHRPAIHGIMSR